MSLYYARLNNSKYGSQLRFRLKPGENLALDGYMRNPNDPLVQTISRSYFHYTRRDSRPIYIGGGTDAKCFPNTVSAGPVGSEDELDSYHPHGPNEWVDIDRVLTFTAGFYASILARFDTLFRK